MKDLEILIKPTLDSTRDSMDISEDDDYDGDDVLRQQGNDMDGMLVSPGDDFSIDNGYSGQIDCENTSYKIKNKKMKYDDDFDDEIFRDGDFIELVPGNYKFHEDGITIEKVK